MPHEVVLTASSSPDSPVLMHDLHSSNLLQTFRQSPTSIHGLVPTPSHCHFLSTQAEKGLVNVYSWGRDGLTSKMILPDKIRCLEISPSGKWCVGGSENGRLFLWELGSGNLLFAREAHYRALTHLCFTADEALLLTGGGDGVVHSWRTMDLVDFALRSEEISPLQSWNDHALPITGVAVGQGTTFTARAYTASLDHTVRIWNLASLMLVTMILFPSPVNCMVLDPAERAVYIGTASSTIYQFSFVQGGGGGYVAVEGDAAHPLQATSQKAELVGHSGPVTAINLSFDGSLLVSGDASGEVFVWDIGSRQVLRKIKGQNGPVTCITPFIKPDETIPLAHELQQFKRLQTERGRMDHDIYLTIPNQENSLLADDAEIAADGLRQLKDDGSEAKLKGRVVELEDELKRIYGAYGELRGLHEKLWKKYVDEKALKE